MSITIIIPQDNKRELVPHTQPHMSFQHVPALPPMYPRRIMIVEDNLAHSRQIQNAVEKWGVAGSLHLCATGEDVFNLLETPKFGLDLALIDLGLPDISGIEVIKRLRRGLPELPIMVISSISTERSVLSAIRAGARGYILKDDSEYVIAHTISQVLMGHYPITPSLAHALFKLAGSPTAADLCDLNFKLSPRELETLQFIAQGLSYEEVGRKMGVALTTVQSNIRSLYRKLDAHSQGQAVSKARAAGLL